MPERADPAPRHRSVRFGVEIEFRCPKWRPLCAEQDHDERVLFMAEIQRALPAGWRVVAEIGTGHEAISPTYTDLHAFHRDATLVTVALRDFGAVVDPFRNRDRDRSTATRKAWRPALVGSRDALHVHLGVRELTPEVARAMGLAYYRRLDAYNDRWAWTGCLWSQPCPTADVYMNLDHLAHPDLFASGCRGGKCRCRPALNIHQRLGTLEARQHPGTLDPDEMAAWIVGLYALAGIDVESVARPSR